MANEPFGPFRTDADPIERVAQLRTLRTLVHVTMPFVASATRRSIEAALREAEQDAFALDTALRLFEALPTLSRRHILSTFAYIHRPLYNSAAKQPKERNANVDLD